MTAPSSIDAADPDTPTVAFDAFDAAGRPQVLYLMLWDFRASSDTQRVVPKLGPSGFRLQWHRGRTTKILLGGPVKPTRRTVAVLMALCMSVVVLLAFYLLTRPPSTAARDKTCDRINSVHTLLRCVTLAGVMEHQWALQRIANANEGTRASGTSGYDASADYVAKRLRKAGYRVSPRRPSSSSSSTRPAFRSSSRPRRAR